MMCRGSRRLVLVLGLKVALGCSTGGSEDRTDTRDPSLDSGTGSFGNPDGGGDGETAGQSSSDSSTVPADGSDGSATDGMPPAENGEGTDFQPEGRDAGDTATPTEFDGSTPAPTGLSTDSSGTASSDRPSETAGERPSETGSDTPVETGTATSPLPNLIVVYTDDQQLDGLGANGNNTILTPRLDTLASQGLRFTQASVVTSLCSPSRAALLTGRFNRSNGVEQLGGDLEPDEVTLAEHLLAEGYRTAVTGKWHIADLPERLGFEFIVRFQANGRYYGREVQDLGEIVVPEEHVDAYCTDRAIDFITDASAGVRPFFLFHNTQAPHWDKQTWPADEETLALYDPDLMPVPGSFDDDLAGKPPYLAETRNVELGDLNGYDSPESIRDEARHYYAAITEVDAILGRLFDAVDGLGLRNNTYIVVMSDNGWLLADHGMVGKVLAYEPSLRVPMFILGPDIPPGTSDALAQNIDVAPTLLDMAGIPIPATMHGKSLLPLLRGQTAVLREIALYETLVGFGNTHPMLGAFDQRYKVIQTRYPDDMALLEFGELYDIVEDPSEMNNLWNDPTVSEAQARLNGAIDAHVDTILGW